MSNLKNLITLACFLMGANFAFGQTVTITDAAPIGDYTPNATETFTVNFSGLSACSGNWDVDATVTSNYEGFSPPVQQKPVTIDAAGTGTVQFTFDMPPSGNILLTVLASKTDPISGCDDLTDAIALVPEETAAGASCDMEFLEDFESVLDNTGFEDNEASPIVVGQGMAYRQSYAGVVADLSAQNSYFKIQVASGGNERLEARNVDSEVYWETNDISISPCCSRDITAEVYGSGDATDYVEVYYRIDGGTPILVERHTGNFGSATVSFSSCDITPITVASNLRVQIRIFNDGANERHGIESVTVTEGTTVSEPQILNISCAESLVEPGRSRIVVTGATECLLNYSIDGGPAVLDNEFIVDYNDSYTITVGDETFVDCGTAESTVFVNAEGNCNFLLPIALLDFYGRAEADAIGLYWSTTTEIDNDYIAVERSLNGVDFEEIGRVEGNGTTTEKQNYTYVDNYPVSGTNYYRLRQVDYDGAAEYHPVISVLFDRPLEFGVKVSPNPARETLWVDWTLPEKQDGVLRVYDMQGQLMSQRAIAQGSGRYNLPIGDLPAGMYVLQMEQGGNLETLRFVKK